MHIFEVTKSFQQKTIKIFVTITEHSFFMLVYVDIADLT